MGFFGKLKGKANELNARRKKRSYEKATEEEWRTIAREISPTSMKIKPRYIKADETYITYFLGGVTRNGKRGLPKNLKPGIIDDLMKTGISGNYTVGVTTSIMRIPAAEASKALHNAEMMQIGNHYVEKKDGESGYVSADTREDLQETSEIIKKVHNSDEVLTWTAFVISILAEDKDAILEAQGHIQQVFDARLIRCEMPIGKFEKTMKTAIPLPYMPEFAHGNPTTKPASMLLAAQNINTASDATGLRLGHRIGSEQQTLTVDLDKLPAKHTLVIGGTGTGKTTGVLMWLYRLYTELGYNIVFVTAKADEGTDHRNLARAAGKNGIIIDIGAGKDSINPLQIVYTEKNVENSEFAWKEVVHNQVGLVIRFFSVFLEETMSAPMRSYINETLIRLYEGYGIYVDHPSTIKEALKTAKYPHIADLIDMWILDRDAGGFGDRGKTINSLISNTFPLTRKGELSYINRDSNIQTDKKVIVIDVSSITNNKLRGAMNVLTTGIMWQKFRSTRKDHIPTAIAVDEAKVFLNNLITRAEILEQLSLARSDGVMCIYMTQQLTDLVKAGVEDEFMNNTFIKVMYGPGGDASKAKLVKEYCNYTDQETVEWVKCGCGEAMINIMGRNTPTKVQLTDFELGMIKGTNFVSKESDNQSTAIGSCIDDRVQELVFANGICLESWCEGEDINKYFAGIGWTGSTFNSATSAGTVKAWMKPRLVVNGMVGSQSDDHYVTVLQIAAYFLLHDIEAVEVHHTDDVDVSIEINGDLVAFEFEKPRSHTKDELLRKQERATEKYSICYFVGITDNIRFLKDAVIKQNVFPRGVQLRRLMDNLIGA